MASRHCRSHLRSHGLLDFWYQRQKRVLVEVRHFGSPAIANLLGNLFDLPTVLHEQVLEQRVYGRQERFERSDPEKVVR